MSSSANTSIYFQPTDTTVKDKRQTNTTSVEEENLSFVNMNVKIKTTKDNGIDVMLQPNYHHAYCARNVFL